MKFTAPFILAAIAMSGCVSDIQENGAVIVQYRRLFEVGRRAELEGNITIAEDTYCWLIRHGSHYGEYGLAMLLLRQYPDRENEAVKYLLSCAKRSSFTINGTVGVAMELAFSAAALAKLSEIAISEHNRLDVADYLRCIQSRMVTPEVRDWAYLTRTNPTSAKNFKDIITAVESNPEGEGRVKCVKEYSWGEIIKVFINEEFPNIAPDGIFTL